MNNNKTIIQNQYFVIDSNNIHEIQSKLYGFGFYDGEIITEKKKTHDLDKNGCYVDINVNDKEIIITQDFLGSYGLYYFNSDDYFALSNSFIMLVKHLINNYDLTFNKEYADAFLFSNICLNVYSETLINEIQTLPRNFYITINKETNHIEFKQIDYKENTIDINTELGVKTIDSWYEKWVKIIRSLLKKSEKVIFELSGGFDTRTVASLWLTADIDLNKFNIVSFNNDIFREDYEIVSKIAETFNFKLNQGLPVSINDFNDKNLAIDLSFYSKASFSNLMYFKKGINNNPTFTLNGGGGETIRSLYNQTPEEYIEHILYSLQNYDSTLKDQTRKVLERSFNLLNENYEYLDSDSMELVEILYKESRARFHFGKTKVEEFISHNFSLSPLLDQELQQINITTDECDDRDLLMALIITRYCPKLMEFEIEGNRSFNKETLGYAKKINDKYPFKPTKKEFIQLKDDNNNDYNILNNNNSDIKKELIKILCSEAFKKDYLKLFSRKSYDKIVEYSHYPGNLHIYGVISALSIILVKNYLTNKSDKEPSEILETYLKDYERSDFDSLVSKYYTASIDIKSYDETCNNIEITELSDKNAQLIRPNYFINENIAGYHIESKKGILNIELECKKDMELNIELKGLNYVIKNNNYDDDEPIRVPLNIDYQSLYVNDNTIIEKSIVANYEKPYIYTMNVKKNEKIKLMIEWSPIHILSNYKRITDKIPCTIVLDDIKDMKIGEKTKVTGKLIDENNNILPDASIKLLINNGRATVRTNEEGKFIHEFEANRVGTNSVTAIFNGNNIYEVSNNAINFEVIPLETEITLETIENLKLGKKTQVKGKLIDEYGNIIPKATIKLLVNNGRATVRTDEEGIFTREINANRVGTNNITAIYNGSNQYKVSSNSTNFEVIPLDTRITLDNIEDTKLGNKTLITGMLFNENDEIVPNATIKFIINNGRATAKTNEKGEYFYEYNTTRTGRINMVVMFLGNKRLTQVIASAQFMVYE